MLIKCCNIFRSYAGVVCVSMSVGGVCADELITLSENAVYELPTNKSAWHNGSCTITSADTEDRKSLTVIGEDGSGRFISNGTAVLENLEYVAIYGSTNTWASIAGDRNDATGYGYGGVFSAKADSADCMVFKNNSMVFIQDVVYDCSDWGATATISSVYGGVFYAESEGSVQFIGNDIIGLQNVGILNTHDTNYCYKDLYGYGGAVCAPELTIKETNVGLTISECFIEQGVCTDVNGYGRGGAVYVDKMQLNENACNIVFDKNVVYVANDARGGAVYLKEKGSEICGNGLHVQFSYNHVTAAQDRKYGMLEDSLAADCHAYGGAIYVADNASLTLSDNVGNVHFENNTATADYTNVTNQGEGDAHWDDPVYALGGAVYLGTGAQLIIENNGQEGKTDYGNVNFSNNRVEVKGTNATTAQGGAVYLAEKSSFTVQNNSGFVSFTGNAAENGAGIYAAEDTVVSLSGNANGVIFADNAATEYGGAVYAAGELTINDNDSVSFCGNSSTFSGGAVYATGELSINGNGDVSFEENGAAYGGAIYAAGNVDIRKNSSVLFKNNGTWNGADEGSAIYAESNRSVNITGNGSVSFVHKDTTINTYSLVRINSGARLNLSSNDLVSISADPTECVVYGEDGTEVRISANKVVEITNCEIMSYGVFRVEESLSILYNTGTVTLSGNRALSASGAVVSLMESGAYLSISGNKGDILIRDNYAGVSGGFVHAGNQGSYVHILDNTNVSVLGNSARSGAGAIDMTGELQIRNNSGAVVFGNNSVYDETTKTYVLKSICAGGSHFSAANGGSLEFRDAVSISGYLELNAEYYDQEQCGEIIFTGEYTDTYALTHLGNDNTVDKDESRHSRVAGAIALENGTLKVMDKAVLEGETLTVASGKNAQLVLSGGGRLSVSDALSIGNDTVLQAGAEDDAVPVSTVAAALDELIRETPVCGVLDCTALTLATGSTYALYGGILDLDGGLLRFEEGATITLSGINTPVSVGTDSFLLLFCGVSGFEAKDVTLAFNGDTYGDENLVFNTNAGVVYLRSVAVPEPSSAVLSLTGITLLMMRRRRRAAFSSAYGEWG